METILAIKDFILDNAAGIAGVIVGAHALALAIVNLTPTPKDDAILGKVYKLVLEPLAGLLTRKAKELPGESTQLPLR